VEVFCTYCSAFKDESEEDLPAIERYQSTRINSIYVASLNVGVGFLILSGKYGLVKACDTIPYYDHLLIASEVPEHTRKVTEQLKARDVKKLVFFTKPISEDKNVRPYMDCIQFACQQAQVEFCLIEISLRVYD
jgi:hypothetical protein